MTKPCNNQPVTPLIVNLGADVSFVVRLRDSETDDPIDLTNTSSVSLVIPKADGTYLTLTLGDGIAISSPATIGKLNVTILAANTSLLEVGILSFEVTMVTNGSTQIVQFQSALSVLDSIFS